MMLSTITASPAISLTIAVFAGSETNTNFLGVETAATSFESNTSADGVVETF